MATITTLTYLDGGTARTAGEAMTINGGKLIVRTDSRWHLNAPATMTGSLGGVTISATLGGSYEIDATKVRWMAINGGSGTCAIGTTITQGAVSGYFLGYWASLTATPSTTIGATGFIKLREVTGGSFVAGALSGITANATSADVTGWIEVVHDQAISITVPRLGKFQTRGDWFYLDNTNGTANQLIQTPTNGSATNYVPGVWIETSAGSNSYEYYPSLYAGGMIAANLGTDARSKFVCMETNGTIRIGHNGTTNIGFIPPTGCKVRIPNIIGRNCLTTTRAVNAIPSATATTRPDFITTSAGAIDCEFFGTDWFLSFSQPYLVRLRNCSTFDYVLLSEVASPIDLYNVGTSTSQSIDQRYFNATSCFAGGTITDCNFQRYASGTTDHAFEIIYCKNIVVNNTKTGIITFARSTGMAIQVTQSTGIILNNCYCFNSAIALNYAFNCEVNDLDYSDRYMGTTNTTGIFAYYLTACNNVKVSGLTFGLKGTIANVHPYLGVFSVGQGTNVKIRNIGSRSTFLNGGTANQPAYIFQSSGNNDSVKLQRIYMIPTRTGALNTTNSDANMIYEHVYGDFADAIAVASLNSSVKNCSGTDGTTGQGSVYGTHFWDVFTSDTAGRLVLGFNESTTKTKKYITTVNGTPKFTSAGNLSMVNVGDEIIIEQDYFVKGCTALTNTAPVITGTNVAYSANARWGNHDIYFQIDTGGGWNGSWTNFTAANLITNSISPTTGFRLKYRIVCAVANTGNLLTYIRVYTTSTLVAQTNNLYPLDTITMKITGLKIGSDVVILQAGTNNVLASSNEVTADKFDFVYETPQLVDIGVIKQGYVTNYTYAYQLSSVDSEFLVKQLIDRNYS